MSSCEALGLERAVADCVEDTLIRLIDEAFLWRKRSTLTPDGR
jgi:hypothetical protein